MDISNLKRVHCIGIGGIGVSAVAKYFRNKGAEVTGSDVSLSVDFRDLETIGIHVHVGHNPESLTEDIDLVVFSPAVPDDDPEKKRALEMGLPVFSYPQVLGKIQAGYKGVGISGTNGKTTTTALAGKFLEAAKKDPTVIVGGKVTGWNKNLRMGKGEMMVAEACEYRRSMLDMSPEIIVLTNIEADHLDYYKDIEDIRSAFREYVSLLPDDGLLIYNADDADTVNVASTTNVRKVSFGLNKAADLTARQVSVAKGRQYFEVYHGDEFLGTLSTVMPGRFNIYNILAAIAVAQEAGVELPAIQQVLDVFPGTWRRFELAGYVKGTTIISDYAHHPTAVRGTIRAARDFYGDDRILAVFQPHHQDRTIKLFDEFVESFHEADELIVSEIYEVEGREEGKRISSKDLVREIGERGGIDLVHFAKDLIETQKMVEDRLDGFDVVLVMGAGDVDMVARRVVAEGQTKLLRK